MRDSRTLAPKRLSHGAGEEGGNAGLLALQWYPALLLFYAAGIAAVSAESYGALAFLMHARIGTSRGEKRLVEAATAELDDLQAHFEVLPGHERQHVPFSEYPHAKQRREPNGVPFHRETASLTALRGSRIRLRPDSPTRVELRVLVRSGEESAEVVNANGINHLGQKGASRRDIHNLLALFAVRQIEVLHQRVAWIVTASVPLAVDAAVVAIPVVVLARIVPSSVRHGPSFARSSRRLGCP